MLSAMVTDTGYIGCNGAVIMLAILLYHSTSNSKKKKNKYKSQVEKAIHFFISFFEDIIN